MPNLVASGQEAVESPWENLTDSLLWQVFSCLPYNTLVQASQVCKHWHRVTQDEYLWKELFYQTFKVERCIPMAPGKRSWLGEFRRLYSHTPRVQSEVLREHRDQVLHVSFSHDGEMFATTSKDGYVKVWHSGYPASLKYYADMREFTWKYTQYTQFNQSDTLLLVSGVHFGSHSTSGEIAVFNVVEIANKNSKFRNRFLNYLFNDTKPLYIDGFELQCRILNKPYDIFGTWYNNSYLLSGNLHWMGNLTSCSALWLNKASQALESEKESVVMRLYMFHNLNASSIRTILVANCRKTSDQQLDASDAVPKTGFSPVSHAQAGTQSTTESEQSAARASHGFDLDLGQIRYDEKYRIAELRRAERRRNMNRNMIQDNADELHYALEDIYYDALDSPLSQAGADDVIAAADIKYDTCDEFQGASLSQSTSHSQSTLQVSTDQATNTLPLFCSIYSDFLASQEGQTSAFPETLSESSDDSHISSNDEFNEVRDGVIEQPHLAQVSESSHLHVNVPESHICDPDSLLRGSSVDKSDAINISAEVTSVGENDQPQANQLLLLSDHPDPDGTTSQELNTGDSPLFLSSERSDINLDNTLFHSNNHNIQTGSSSSSTSSDDLSGSDQELLQFGLDCQVCSARHSTEPLYTESLKNNPIDAFDYESGIGYSDQDENDAEFNLNLQDQPDDLKIRKMSLEDKVNPTSAIGIEINSDSNEPISACSSDDAEVETGDKYLIFTMGKKTYTPHQIGVKRIRSLEAARRVDVTNAGHGLRLLPNVLDNETDWHDFDVPDKVIEMNGHIIGMRLSPEHRYLYVNSRTWPDNYTIEDPLEPPPIAQEIDIHVIDLMTMQEVGTMHRSHRAFTPNDECFFIFLDVCEDYVASGAEDKHGYLWDRHYGACLAKYPHSDVVNSVAFNPKDPETLISVSDDHSIKIWRSRHRQAQVTAESYTYS